MEDIKRRLHWNGMFLFLLGLLTASFGGCGETRLGCLRNAELTPRHIAAAPPVAEPGALSAFPLLGEPTATS